MSDPARYSLDWYAGPSAQVEIFSPISKRKTRYGFKYTPPFRATMRPPVELLALGKTDLEPIDSQLEELASALSPRSAARPGRAREKAQPALASMERIGAMLMDLICPDYVKADLRPGPLFLEIGMDEGLLRYPWELMHDGTEFLCLKHYVGRYVNTFTSAASPAAGSSQLGADLEPLKVLIIAVPGPQDFKGKSFDRLPAAQQEAQDLLDTLTALPGVEPTLLLGSEAIFDNVYATLKAGVNHIIHFCGHAYFDKKNPQERSLVLHDKPMTTGAIARFFPKTHPILCFINACDSTRASGKDKFNIFDLARAFLDTGAYLLGSRWEVGDEPAAGFAKHFYTSLLGNCDPLGQAVQKARLACRAEQGASAELAWSSYVLYGDPRLCFRTKKPDPPAARTRARPRQERVGGRRRARAADEG
ncbi:MAG TPA: CHAT domain-containing protein [Isosphaeraceae bacterium]|nr:CHAT domain-containing protein [Isosphaeraceae bacterium]